MENFIEDISSIYWWISVVVIGVVLNLAADYIRLGLSKLSSGAARRYRERSEASRRTTELYTQFIVRHPTELDYLYFRLLRWTVIMFALIISGGVSMGLMVLVKVISPDETFWEVAFGAMGAFYLIFALKLVGDYDRDSDIGREARRRISENRIEGETVTS